MLCIFMAVRGEVLYWLLEKAVNEHRLSIKSDHRLSIAPIPILKLSQKLPVSLERLPEQIL
jgi:hypothetical protein